VQDDQVDVHVNGVFFALFLSLRGAGGSRLRRLRSQGEG